jgi:biopolymer transport protein ExbD
MSNRSTWSVFLGVFVGVLLTFLGVIATGRAMSAYSMRQAEAERLEAERTAADAERRAAENAKPQPDDLQGTTIVIDLKVGKDSLVVMAGDGTIMRQVPRQELAPFLKKMRHGGKTQASLRADGESPYKSVAEVLDELQTAGFDKIHMRTLPDK